jgi:hypothetical protein
MLNWFKKHKLLAGSLAVLVVVLYFVLRGRSSASTPSATVVSTANPNVQAAQIAAGVQQQTVAAQTSVAQAQIDRDIAIAGLAAQTKNNETNAARDVALKNIITSGQLQNNTTAAALQSVIAQVGGQVSQSQIQANAAQSIANINASGAVQIASIGAGRDVSIATIGAGRDVQLGTLAADVAKVQSYNALEAVKNTNAAGVTLGLASEDTKRLGITTTGQVDLAKIAADQSVAITQSNNALTYGVTNSNNALAAVGLATNAYRDVNITGINAAKDITLTDLQLTHDINSQIIQGINQRVYNLGGAGGANQVAALAAFTGQPSVAATAQAGQVGNSPGAIITSIGNAAGKILGGLFG